MKIRLEVSEEKYEEVSREFMKAGFVIDDEASFVLSERGVPMMFINARDEKGDRVKVKADDVVFIESYGHNVDIHTEDATFACQSPLGKLMERLDPGKFIRISNSVIISRRHVRKIRPSLYMKFVLELSDGTIVDVTRNYYGAFREFFNV